VRPFVVVILLITLVTAVLCGTIAGLPDHFARPLFLVTHVFVPTLLASSILFDRGAFRAFAVGAAIPFGISLYGISNAAFYWLSADWLAGVDDTAAPVDLGFYNAAILCSAIICGLVSTCVLAVCRRSVPEDGAGKRSAAN
jgi:hypothetical protein